MCLFVLYMTYVSVCLVLVCRIVLVGRIYIVYYGMREGESLW